MVLKVKLSRLLRKKALDSSSNNRPYPYNRPQSRIIFNAVIQIATPSLVVGYFIAFSYSASLAPATLLAAVFVASIASLLSELCRFEFLTCRRNTSACSYICTYQLLGEICAHLYGWMQLLGRGATVALLSRFVGSTLVLVIGKHLLQLNIVPPALINEGVIGVLAQTTVSLFVFLGLKMTTHFTVAVKLSLLVAVTILMSQIGSITLTLPTDPDSENLLGNDRTPLRDELLMSAALLSTMFKPENKEPQILTKSSLMSTFLGIQYCSTLFIFVVISIVYCLLPTSFFTSITSGSPMVEVLMAVTTGPHWSTAIFACCCILIGSISLVEAIQDSKRLITKMSSDGLIFKHLATKNYFSLLFHCLLSNVMQLTMSTLNLVILISLIHLWLDSLLGLVVTYRRYCSPLLRQFQSKSHSKTSSNAYNVLGRQHPESPSDSDDTDIDAAVDDFKNQMYVSTIMEWNGSEGLSRHTGDTADGKASGNVPYYLLSVSVVIFILSLAMRWISNLNYISFCVSFLSFITYNVFLFIIWNHPQRPTASNPIFKVPCVPWIPIGSTLLNSIMLFQLPSLSWLVFLIWLATGVILYFGYGYRKSRLNFKVQDVNHGIKKEKTRKQKMHILHESMLDVTSSSIAVYPQPYYRV